MSHFSFDQVYDLLILLHLKHPIALLSIILAQSLKTKVCLIADCAQVAVCLKWVKIIIYYENLCIINR